MIISNNKKIGWLFVLPKDDGVIPDKIYLENEYQNKGIGTDIIKNILKDNSFYLVLLWNALDFKSGYKKHNN